MTDFNTRKYCAAEEIIKRLPGVTIGYIGNVYMDGTDDRSWCIFLPHPGRVGELSDRLGGYPTDRRGELSIWAKALEVGYNLARKETT